MPHAFIELLMLQKDRHPLFATAIKKTRNLRRTISTFRRTPMSIISISAHPIGMNGPFVIISWFVFKWSEERWLRKNIKLYLITGDIESELDIPLRPYMRKQYSLEDLYRTKYLLKEFDTINKKLQHPKTVRVDPYDYNRVLQGEETDVDIRIAKIFEEVGRWQRALERCTIAPGIITPRDDAELN